MKERDTFTAIATVVELILLLVLFDERMSRLESDVKMLKSLVVEGPVVGPQVGR